MIKWENSGQIFEIDEVSETTRFTHAQSPQLIDIDNGFRVYFSARPKILDQGMPRSDVYFVEFDLNFNQKQISADNSIISKGRLGTFDQHGIFPFHIYKHNQRLFGYISGWSRRSDVPVETAIGLSESFDEGKTFERLGEGPIMAATPSEPFLVGDPTIIEADEVLHMFYIAGVEWVVANDIPERIYKIKHAKSMDGVNWERSNKSVIPDTLNAYECQALPTVVFYKNYYLMVYCYREALDFRNEPSRGYRLGAAVSKNLIDWEIQHELINIPNHPTLWDNEMRCYPNLSVREGELLLLYNGNNFGKKGFGLAIGRDLENN